MRKESSALTQVLLWVHSAPWWWTQGHTGATSVPVHGWIQGPPMIPSWIMGAPGSCGAPDSGVYWEKGTRWPKTQNPGSRVFGLPPGRGRSGNPDGPTSSGPGIIGIMVNPSGGGMGVGITEIHRILGLQESRFLPVDLGDPSGQGEPGSWCHRYSRGSGISMRPGSRESGI